MDDQLVYFDIKEEKPSFKSKFKETINCLDFNSEGNMMAYACLDGRVGLINLGEEIEEIYQLEGPTEELSSLSFHPKGNALLGSSRDGSIWVWNCNKGKAIKSFYGHNDSVSQCNFTPSGKLIASISEDNTFKVWKISQDEPIVDIRHSSKNFFHTDSIVAFDMH